MNNIEEKKTAPVTIAQALETPEINKFISDTLGEKKGQFISDILSLANATPKLAECKPNEVIKCAITAVALGLPLNKNLGFSYVIPYNNSKKVNGAWIKTLEPQFQIGWKGFVQLALRTKQYKSIHVTEVREGEIEFNKFTGDFKILGEFPDGDVVGYLGYFSLINGFEKSDYWTIKRCEDHATKYSKSKDYTTKELSGQWKDNFDAMAKKTVLKNILSKWGILSVELEKAIVLDQSNVDGDYIDNPKEELRTVDAEIITQKDDNGIDFDNIEDIK